MRIDRISPAAWGRWLLWMLALTLSAAAWADPPGRVGRLGETRGTVWLFDVDAGEWVAAQRNRPLTTGDRVATDRDGLAELRIGSTTLRLAGGSDLEFERLDDERMQLRLHAGSAAARLRQRDAARDFELRTAEGRFLPQGPGHFRIDRTDGRSYAGAWDGSLRFDAPDSTLVLDDGQRAEFWQEAGTSHYTWATLPRDGFADWVLAEDRRDDRLAAQRHVSPEMTGWEDLDAYGRWDRHPDYGVIWIPTTVVAGWAPYRHGRWVWRSPWGWTWVDDAPWGFAPFHYGRWAWWGSRWVWVPGTYVARPVYAPALVGWVGGPSVNVSIHIGGGPVVGWVPLGPWEPYRPVYRVGPDYGRRINPPVPDRHRRPPPSPGHGPIMYTNQGVPGGVTVVPADVLKQRQPIAGAAARIEPRVAQELVRQAPRAQVPPPPPAVTTATQPVRAATPPPGWTVRSGGVAEREPGAEGGRSRRPAPVTRDEPRAQQVAPSVEGGRRERDAAPPGLPRGGVPPSTGPEELRAPRSAGEVRIPGRSADEVRPPGRPTELAPPRGVDTPPPGWRAPGSVPIMRPAVPATSPAAVPAPAAPGRGGQDGGDDGRRSHRPADPGVGGRDRDRGLGRNAVN